MRLYKCEPGPGSTGAGDKLLVNEFASSDAALNFIRQHTLHPHAFAVIVTHDDDELDQTLWIME